MSVFLCVNTDSCVHADPMVKLFMVKIERCSSMALVHK